MNKDYLAKYLVLNNQARVITVFSTNCVNDYCKNVKTSPTAIAAMGRLISANLMMGSMLKGKEKIMVSIDGGGPIGIIRAEADANGNVRAFATNPLATVPINERKMLDVASLVGSEGTLSVRKQLNMKEPFIGTCELISGEIGEDLSYYYGTSEQTPTVFALGVLANEDGTCKQAGGFLIQLLPKANEEAIEYVENLLKEIKSVSALLTKVASSDELVADLFKEYDKLFEYPVAYKCTCSKEKTLALVSQLEESEIKEAISKDEGLDVTCNFCQHVYHLDSNDLQEVLAIKNENKYKVK